ncbi:hypothetical protein [Serratia fonticola]|uniref:hypothetical protein n=1 Tax=Serratia fonticola TaxID=47917 RepID=UPI00192D103A|nr:hypothetical protein [Serratia fonticola]MBL5825935.1 hypothetical protein [Serratia fonticola]
MKSLLLEASITYRLARIQQPTTYSALKVNLLNGYPFPPRFRWSNNILKKRSETLNYAYLEKLKKKDTCFILLNSMLAGGRRQAAGGRRQAAGGRRQAAGGRRRCNAYIDQYQAPEIRKKIVPDKNFPLI